MQTMKKWCFLVLIAVLPTVALAASADAGSSLDALLSQLSEAVSGRQWSLALSLALVGAVMVLRKLASGAAGASNPLSRALLWLSTPKGAVVLSMVGGTATLLSVALGSGKPFSLGLLVSCCMSAASASGLFSWGQTLVKPKPTAGPVCGPEDYANGICRP